MSCWAVFEGNIVVESDKVDEIRKMFITDIEIGEVNVPRGSKIFISSIFSPEGSIEVDVSRYENEWNGNKYEGCTLIRFKNSLRDSGETRIEMEAYLLWFERIVREVSTFGKIIHSSLLIHSDKFYGISDGKEHKIVHNAHYEIEKHDAERDWSIPILEKMAGEKIEIKPPKPLEDSELLNIVEPDYECPYCKQHDIKFGYFCAFCSERFEDVKS